MHDHSTKIAFTERLFDYRSVEKRKLILSLSITLVVMIVEVVGGFLTHSIALISDAGHMFTHCFALGISVAAIMIARKPLCHHRTFGLYRADIIERINRYLSERYQVIESTIQMTSGQAAEVCG
jgi:cobalt-zinc-cadmium efflux system protein